MQTFGRFPFLLVVLIGALTLAKSAEQPPPEVNVLANVATVGEPNGFAEFMILKSPGSDAIVRFELLGTAIRDEDYSLIGDATAVLVPSGSNVAVVRIQVLDDFLDEPDKTIILRILPDPAAYTIGASSEAVITLRSNDPSSLPFVFIELYSPLPLTLNPRIVSPKSPLTFRAIRATGTPQFASVFLDSSLISTSKLTHGYSGWQFMQTLPTPLPGFHILAVAVTDISGISGLGTAQFRVADALLTPSSIGSITNGILASTNDPFNPLFTVFDGGNGPSGAHMEFRIPPAATNLKAILFIERSSSSAPHQLLAYPADGVVSASDATASMEFIAMLLKPPGAAAGFPNLDFQIDVTPWARQNAGGCLGFQLKVDPSLASSEPSGSLAGRFENCHLAFFSAANDVPLHFDWVNYPTNKGHPVDQPFTFQLELYDPDSRTKRIQVTELPSRENGDKYSVVTAANVDLPSGTNVVSLQTANLPPGRRTFVIEVSTETGSVTRKYSEITFYPREPDGPAHRWLGTDGDSTSFYVVDAAGRAWVWGSNNYGQLGLGFKSEPIGRPILLAPPAGKKWRRFTSNPYGAAGQTDDSLLYGMGQTLGVFGSFPAGTSGPWLLPRPATRFYTRSATLAQSALFVIDETRTLEARLGASNLSIPFIAEVDAGGSSVIALGTNGVLHFGYVGGLTQFPANPGIRAAAPWTAVSACSTHWLALDSVGQLFAWGSNFSGELPFASSSPYPTPEKAPFPAGVTAWKKICAGKYVSLAVDSNGRLFSWGKQGYTGSAAFSRSTILPVEIPAEETDWLDIAVGSDFAVALSQRGNVYIWGDIPASPAARHVILPELVTGLPDLLDPAAPAGAFATFDPASIRLSGALEVDVIAPAGLNLPVQTSRDLIHWMVLTNIPSSSGKTRLSALPGVENLFIRIQPQ